MLLERDFLRGEIENIKKELQLSKVAGIAIAVTFDIKEEGGKF